MYHGYFRQIALSCLAAVCVAASIPNLVQAKQLIAAGGSSIGKQQSNFSPRGPLVEPMRDARALIEQMHERALTISDYSLDFEMTVFKKTGGTVFEKGNFYYKKPGLIRLEETGDYKNGAVAVIGADGKARGHYGGAMRFVKLTLAPNAPELHAANGYPLNSADFLSLTVYLKRLLSEGDKARVSEHAQLVDGLPQPSLVLEIFRPGEPNLVIKRIFINPANDLPLRWDDYDYPSQSITVWKNVKINCGLSSRLFEI